MIGIAKANYMVHIAFDIALASAINGVTLDVSRKLHTYKIDTEETVGYHHEQSFGQRCTFPRHSPLQTCKVNNNRYNKSGKSMTNNFAWVAIEVLA